MPILRRVIRIHQIKEVERHEADYQLRMKGHVYWFHCPCNSYSHYILTGLFFNWSWGHVDIPEEVKVNQEEAKALKVFFEAYFSTYQLKKFFEKVKDDQTQAKKEFIRKMKIQLLKSAMAEKGDDWFG